MKRIIRSFKKGRGKYIKKCLLNGRRKFFSPILYSQYMITIPLVKKFAYGKFIDIGCGDQSYKKLILNSISSYESLDVEKRAEEINFISDICNMKLIRDKTYDSAMCLEVLEHVSNPYAALCEINRILKKGGVVIISVPHLSRLHEEPYDYLRYTKYGLEALLKETGFEIKTLVARGGLLSFFCHQISTIIKSIFFPIPILRSVFYYFNKVFFVCLPFKIDGYIDKRKRFAAGYTCVAIKK